MTLVSFHQSTSIYKTRHSSYWPYQCHKPVWSLHLGHKTRNKSRGTHCGVEANISGKFFQLCSLQRTREGLEGLCTPTYCFCARGRWEHTQCSTSMVSVSVWGERGRLELLMRGAGVKVGVEIAVSKGQGRCSASNHQHQHHPHHHHIGTNKLFSLRD